MYTRFVSLTISIRILEQKERVIVRMLSIILRKHPVLKLTGTPYLRLNINQSNSKHALNRMTYERQYKVQGKKKHLSSFLLMYEFT